MGNVILIGFMGSGKTTVGLRLSYRLRQADFFAAEGEEYFRQRETACLKKMLRGVNNHIISVGGGLPLREENRRLLHELGQVFYLRANAGTIYERLKGDTTRPLLQCSDPRKKIRTMMRQRDSFYMDAADVVIQVDNKSFEQILNEIEDSCSSRITNICS